MMKFEESSIPQTLSVLESGKGRAVQASEVHFAVKSYIAGITDFLALVKNKQTPTAVEIQDLKGNFIFGAVVSHRDAEGDDEAADGNWNYVFTFNKSDVPEDALVYTITNSQVFEVIAKRAFDLCRLTFTTPELYAELAIDVFNTIKDFLDQNAPAAEGEKFEVELEGYFEASVSIEAGEKWFSILPKGEMKHLLKKADDDNEK